MKRIVNNYRQLVILLAVVLFISCHSQPGIQYPPGGYDYPVTVSGRDTLFYYYPLRNTFSRRDSFNSSLAYFLFQDFDEPNISLRPLPEETFRLSYGTAFNDCTFITLSPGWLTIKQGKPDSVHVPYDSLLPRLPAIEAEHWELLERRYPLDEPTNRRLPTRRYLDSMIKLYPQLLDVNYYYKLTEKLTVRTNIPFHYSTNRIKITDQEYTSIIHAINRSGYWSMPHEIDCQATIADGYAFGLEANTKSKYNLVIVSGCPNDTSAFTAACQQLVKLAKLDKEIDLPWPEKHSPSVP